MYVKPVFELSEGESFGAYYGVVTFDGHIFSLTARLGWGFAGSKVANKPIFMIGGELYQLGSKVKLITENWFPPNSDIKYLSFGFRFFGKHLAADLGFIYPAGSKIRGFSFIPWVGFAYNFKLKNKFKSS